MDILQQNRFEAIRQNFLSGAAAQVSPKPLTQTEVDYLHIVEDKKFSAGPRTSDDFVWARQKKVGGAVTFEIQGGTLRTKYRAAGGSGQKGHTFDRGWNDRRDMDIEMASESGDVDFFNRQSDYVKKSQVKRGNKNKITTFSRSSRNNLLDTLNSVKSRSWYTAKFVTLTYHDDIPTHARAYRDLDALFKRLDRYVEKHNKRHSDNPFEPSAIWRMEVKERLSGLRAGEPAPHFHLFLFNCPYIPQPTLLRWWQEITGDKSIDRVEIKRVDNRRAAAGYIAKYTAKDEASGAAVELVGKSLDELRQYVRDNPNDRSASAYLVLALYLTDGGRMWGIFGRAFFPFDQVKSVTLPLLHVGASKFIAFCEGEWSFLADRWSVGFRIFDFGGLEWLHEVLDECLMWSDSPPVDNVENFLSREEWFSSNIDFDADLPRTYWDSEEKKHKWV